MNYPGIETEFARVRKDSDYEKLVDILSNPSADHNPRVFLANNLKFWGYSIDEAARLIANNTRWSDYDPQYTYYMLGSIFNVRASPVEKKSRSRSSRTSKSVIWRRLPYGFNDNFSLRADYCKEEVDLTTGQRATYRTVHGKNHTLLVLDLDAPESRLQDVWDDTKKLIEKSGPWWVKKFSGQRGFHVIDRLNGVVPSKLLKEMALERADEAGIDTSFIDMSMYQKSHVIRRIGSLNLKSGMKSVRVDTSMSLEDIIKSAREGGTTS